MSSKRFEDLQEDFNVLLKELKFKIDLNSRASGEDKKTQIRQVQRALDEVQSFLPELEKESNVAPHPYRQIMTNQIKQYRQELEKITRQVTQLGITSNRQQLLATSSPSTPLGTLTDRGRLTQMNKTLERTTDSIARTHQLAAETDQIGTEVIEELGTQRESLINIKERLVDTDDNLRASRRILRAMYRRVITNKLILVVIILLELGILAGVVYFKFFSHKK